MRVPMRAGRLVRRGGVQNHTGISPGTAIMTAISKKVLIDLS